MISKLRTEKKIEKNLGGKNNKSKKILKIYIISIKKNIYIKEYS